jgi:hypothetical protein
MSAGQTYRIDAGGSRGSLDDTIHDRTLHPAQDVAVPVDPSEKAPVDDTG